MGRVGDARSIDALVELLQDSDRLSVRLASADALGEMADPRCVKPLAEILGSGGEFWVKGIEWRGFGSKIRQAAARGLGQIADDHAIKALVRALGHEEDLVRSAAVSALCRIGKPAVDSLREALGNKGDRVRAGAVRVLGAMRDAGAARALAQALHDDDRSVRENAVKALDDLGWQPADDTEKAHYLIAKGNFHGLMALGESAVEPLIHALGYPDPGVRRWAPGWLGNIGDKRAVQPLIEHLKGKTLRYSGGRIMAEDSDLARAEAAEALGKIGDPSATQALLEALRYPGRTTSERAIERAAAQALFKIGHGATEALVQAMEDNPALRTHAAELLKRLGWRPRDGEEKAWYLLAQGDRDGLVALGEKAIGPLTQILRESGIGDAWQIPAVGAAGEIGHPGAVEPLVNLLRQAAAQPLLHDSVTAALAKIGPPAVEPLMQALGDEDDGLRIAAAKILGEIRDQRAIEPLVRAFESDGHWVVRSAAALALGRMGDSRAVPSLIRGLTREHESDRTSAMRSLGKMKAPEAVEPLIHILLGDETTYVRKEAARALGEIGDEAAAGALEKALQGEDEVVRQEAEAALARMAAK